MSIFAHTIYKTTLKFTRHFGLMGNDLILVMQCCWLLIKIMLIITGYTSRILWTDLYITTYSNRIWSSRFITLVSSAMLLVMRLQSRFMSEKHYFRRFRSILIGFIRTLSFTRVSESSKCWNFEAFRWRRPWGFDTAWHHRTPPNMTRTTYFVAKLKKIQGYTHVHSVPYIDWRLKMLWNKIFVWYSIDTVEFSIFLHVVLSFRRVPLVRFSKKVYILFLVAVHTAAKLKKIQG